MGGIECNRLYEAVLMHLRTSIHQNLILRWATILFLHNVNIPTSLFKLHAKWYGLIIHVPFVSRRCK